MVDIIPWRNDTTLVEPANTARQGAQAWCYYTNAAEGMGHALLTCHSTPQQSCLLCGRLHTQTPQCSLQYRARDSSRSCCCHVRACTVLTVTVLTAYKVWTQAVAACSRPCLLLFDPQGSRITSYTFYLEQATTGCAPCFIMTCKNLITTFEEGLIST